MRYPVFAILVAVLTLLTGLCLGQLVTFGRSLPSEPSVSIADARVGGEFYRSVNAYLADGDIAGLELAVDPAVDTNLPGIASGSGLAGLTGYLDRLKTIDPAFQLVPDAMQSSLQGITTTVSFQSTPGLSIAGLPISPASFWGSSDYLELREGRVVALWTSMPAIVDPMREPSRTTSALCPTLIEPTLERWSLKPHIVYRPETGKTPTMVRMLAGSTLIAIEKNGDGAANLRWASGSADSELLRPGAPVQLNPGDVVSIAPLARFTVVALGPDPAELVATTQERLASTDTLARDSHRESDGVPRLILARGAPRATAGESLNLEALQLELPAGSKPLAHTAERFEIVFVASGKLRLTIESGKAWQANPDRSATKTEDTLVVEAEAGFVIDRGSQVRFEPLDGDVSLWFVTVVPA